MKYWREQDFQNLGVEVPEGHRQLILNMVTKIHTPKLKSGENRSFIPLNRVISEILGQRNAWFEVAGHICLLKTYQQIQKLSNLGAKVCLTAVKLQMFGYQACHVCTQLEHVFLSRVHTCVKTTVLWHMLHMLNRKSDGCFQRFLNCLLVHCVTKEPLLAG